MNASTEQQFRWALRDAGLSPSLAVFETLKSIVEDFAEAEYERGYDEGCREIDDPRDDFTHGPV